MVFPQSFGLKDSPDSRGFIGPFVSDTNLGEDLQQSHCFATESRGYA